MTKTPTKEDFEIYWKYAKDPDVNEHIDNPHRFWAIVHAVKRKLGLEQRK